MLQSAARDLGLDLRRSWMIGDKVCDLAAGAAAGCRTVLVRTGYGAGFAGLEPDRDYRLAGVVRDLAEAVALWARERSSRTDT
jgi:D-glycero-D-manno-heptose 1,7-bisphosphate phosphatase